MNSKADFPTYANTIECAKLCNLASFRDEVPCLQSSFFESAGTSKLTPHFAATNRWDTDVAIVTSKKHKYVAVAIGGTESHQDWQSNLIFIQSEFGPGGIGEAKRYRWKAKKNVKVHYGFNRAFFAGDLHLRLSQALEAVLKEYSNYKIIVCGHSLGGSLSILAGVFFANEFPCHQITVLNFGAPRVGNEAFKRWVHGMMEKNLTIWRLVYEEDIVARLPPRSTGYHHVGHLIQLYKDKAPKSFYLHWGDKKKYAGPPKSEWNVFPDSDVIDAIKDHKLPFYLDSLESMSEILYNHDECFVDSFEVIN